VGKTGRISRPVTTFDEWTLTIAGWLRPRVGSGIVTVTESPSLGVVPSTGVTTAAGLKWPWSRKTARRISSPGGPGQAVTVVPPSGGGSAQEIRVGPGEDGSVPASGRGVTLLQFRRVLPPSAWLRASILWADDLAAIWPENPPMPFDSAQEQALNEILLLEREKLFQERYIPPDLADVNAETVRAALAPAGAHQLVAESWQDGGSAVGLVPDMADQLLEYDAETFVYPDKFPEPVLEELKRLNLVERGLGGGYVMARAEALNWLLAAYASALAKSSEGRLIPDVEEPAQARKIAAPLGGAEGIRQAVVIAIRGAATPNLQTDFRRFIDFRKDDKNERARQDYIGQLMKLWNMCAVGGPEHADKQLADQVTADLRKARDSYFKRVGAQSLAAQTLTSLGAVIPLAAAAPLAAIAGALASVGAAAVTVAVRTNAPAYVRRASNAELLAPMASL
jgi:hypothetical protein